MAKRPVDWQDQPPAHQTSLNVDLIRCPTSSTGPWLITCEKHVGCQLYWLNGRSNPHLGEGCPGCEANRPHRWNGWLCVYDERRLRHCILEITPNCLVTINEFLMQMKTLRGARILLRRQNGKFNGRITAEMSRSELTDLQIPQPFDLAAEMERLWLAPNRSEKVKLETPRVHEEKPLAKKFDAATQTKSYDATPEQKKMLKKNRNDFDTEFAQAKAQLDAGTPLKRLSQLGIRREVMEALTKVELAKSKAKTNGTKH